MGNPLITKQDFRHSNPRCNCAGVVKAGTEVYFEERIGGYTVRHHKDVAHFMHKEDFAHSYVDVPAFIDIEEKPL